MGRLTLNVLLSFAQFEREVTGGRIRDKIAASKKKGLWMGGVVPLGYRLDGRKLLVDEGEAATVRLIFSLYLQLGSVRALQRELKRRDIRTRVRVLASGQAVGGVHLTNGPLSHILRNRTTLARSITAVDPGPASTRPSSIKGLLTRFRSASRRSGSPAPLD